MSKSKAFNSIILSANSSGTLQIEPKGSPFFEASRVQITALDPSDPRRELDIKIGAITVGGSPQLANNCLTPDSTSAGLRPSDLDDIELAIFSTVGLARELQVALYNPNDVDVIVFGCMDGHNTHSLPEYIDEYGIYPPCEHGDDVEEIVNKKPQALSSPELTIKPYGKGFIEITPHVCPYFQPTEVRFHGARRKDGEAIPFAIIDAFCGKQTMFGALFNELKHNNSWSGDGGALDNVYKLERQIESLVRHGGDGLRPVGGLQKSNGALTTHLIDNGKSMDVNGWSIFSTIGLGQPFGFVVHNPWPFTIRASVTVKGYSVTSLRVAEETLNGSLSHTPEFKLPKNGPDAPANLLSLLEECYTGLSRVSVFKRASRNNYELIARIICQENLETKTQPIASVKDIADYCMKCMQHEIKEMDDPGVYRVTAYSVQGSMQSKHVDLTKGASAKKKSTKKTPAKKKAAKKKATKRAPAKKAAKKKTTKKKVTKRAPAKKTSRR